MFLPLRAHRAAVAFQHKRRWASIRRGCWLAGGGTAIVYAAMDTLLARQVALKVGSCLTTVSVLASSRPADSSGRWHVR